MFNLRSIFKRAYWSLAAGGLIYVTFIFLMTYPSIQRFALYAHKVNPTFWQDVNAVEVFGFLQSQVQPFNLVTPDNETLYGWHVLPLELCCQHERLLFDNEATGPAPDYTKTLAFKLLAEDPNARVVVNFHGNAAHLASSTRPDIYRMAVGLSTPQNPVHVFTIDYRGFGLSTGFPTEEGLITDGMALLNFLTSAPLHISPSRIVVMGQSLGTAVTAGVIERYFFGSPDSNAVQTAIKDPVKFAGVILVASFSNLPTLIESYSVKGLTPPMLSPLMQYPRAQKWVMDHIIDRWDTASRLARLTGVRPTVANESNVAYAGKELDLTIIHAYNDVEIPWYEGYSAWIAATGEGSEGASGEVVYERSSKNGPGQVKVWENVIEGSTGCSKKRVKRVRWERVGYGGHNEIAIFSVTAISIFRAFEE